MKALAANSRTVSAIRKADALPTVIPGGRMRKGNVQTPGGSSTYSGPFAVAKLTDTSVEVLGYSVADSQYWNNYIINGLYRIELADGASVTSITSSGYLYASITWGGVTYACTLVHATTLPPQDATHIYVPLAYIVCADSKISTIQQIRQGIIEFSARAG